MLDQELILDQELLLNQELVLVYELMLDYEQKLDQKLKLDCELMHDKDGNFNFTFAIELKDDRMEKCKNGRRYVHCAFAASIFKAQRLRQY